MTTKGALPGDKAPGTVKPTPLGGPDEATGLFFLAGLKGYLEPCGCTADVLLGGIERIVGYVRHAKKLYGKSLVLDGGDTFFEKKDMADHEVPQAKAQSSVIAKGHRRMGTDVTVPGERDLALGVDVYLEKLDEAKLDAVAANLEFSDHEDPQAYTVLDGEESKFAVVGAVSPSLYEGLDGVKASKPIKQLAKLEKKLTSHSSTVLLWHGKMKGAVEILEKLGFVDFVIIGEKPRQTDQVRSIGTGYTFEAYDQGRYVGHLKLFMRDPGGHYVNAGAASKTEVEKLKEQRRHVGENLERLKNEGKKDVPIYKRLSDRYEKLGKEIKELEEQSVSVPKSRNAFIYEPVPMKPGYPIDKSVQEARLDFNSKLSKLNAQVEREVVPVSEGQAEYVGTNQCATCHGEAHEFWKKTRHASAVETLEERGKAFDQNCIGCHVVGYEKPGGSVLGKLTYKSKVNGREIKKNLKDVGCESCHGPGSKHISNPVSKAGKPQHIGVDVGKAACADCHVKQHSPKFDFETYVRKITGPGHELSK